MHMLLVPPPPPPAQIVLCGPPAPKLRGTHPPTATFSTLRALKAAMEELAGAVVVVEEDGSVPVPKLPSGFSIFNGKFQLRPGSEPMNGVGVPPPSWMDPNVVMSNPNAATRTYTVGGLGF